MDKVCKFLFFTYAQFVLWKSAAIAQKQHLFVDISNFKWLCIWTYEQWQCRDGEMEEGEREKVVLDLYGRKFLALRSVFVDVDLDLVCANWTEIQLNPGPDLHPQE